MNKFNLCAFADEAGNALGEQISALKDNGFGMLEIRGVDGENISVISKEKAKRIKAELDAAELKVWAIGSPSGKSSIKDDFAPCLDQFKYMLDLADILGATHYRLFSFYECDGTAARDEVMLRLNRFVEESKGSDLVLCHENEKDIYGEMAAECLDIHKSVPGLKAVFDPANFLLCGQSVMPAWELLEPYVEYLHVKDATLDGAIVPAGEGDGAIAEVLTRFAAKGGKTLTLEPHLFSFGGRAALGREEGEKKSLYETQRDAFDAGAKALIKIAKEI